MSRITSCSFDGARTTSCQGLTPSTIRSVTLRAAARIPQRQFPCRGNRIWHNVCSNAPQGLPCSDPMSHAPLKREAFISRFFEQARSNYADEALANSKCASSLRNALAWEELSRTKHLRASANRQSPLLASGLSLLHGPRSQQGKWQTRS